MGMITFIPKFHVPCLLKAVISNLSFFNKPNRISCALLIEILGIFMFSAAENMYLTNSC